MRLTNAAPLVLMLATATPAWPVPTAAQLCESAVELASAKYAQCRFNAESKYSLTLDAAKRGTALAKCTEKWIAAYSRATTRYGGASCTAATASEYDAYLTQCTDEAAAAAAVGGRLPECGNGVIDVAGEQCDGADLGGESCTSLGFAGGSLGCTSGCAYDTSGCAATYCGNGAIDGAEACDGSAFGGATCVSAGFAGGVLRCASGCTLETTGCFAARWSDNGDGTMTDHETGLMWEQKTDDGGVHDKDNVYTWTEAADGDTTDPDGTVFTVFFAALSACTSDQLSPSPGFAGHCDWRLPTFAEAQTLQALCGPPPCYDPILGDQPGSPVTTHWVLDSLTGVPTHALVVQAGNVWGAGGGPKTGNLVEGARAVRRIP